MEKFFISRPIFAISLAIVIVLVGLISILNLPIEQYPDTVSYTHLRAHET
mgnify:CR=1 FL=1